LISDVDVVAAIDVKPGYESNGDIVAPAKVVGEGLNSKGGIISAVDVVEEGSGAVGSVVVSADGRSGFGRPVEPLLHFGAGRRDAGGGTVCGRRGRMWRNSSGPYRPRAWSSK
jgi:hypothetical protein